MKPRFRGVSHEWAFFLFAGLGVALGLGAPNGEARFAVTIYAVSVCALFGASALYHRITWASATARRWMRRLDHSMIFLLIAGTYTPFALLALEGTIATVILVLVWTGAAFGHLVNMLGIDAPNWVTALNNVTQGWEAVAAFPSLVEGVGITGTTLVAVGGVLYTVGAVIYARRRPDPAPTVFGYHEIFHLLVVAAAALHYAAVAFIVLPSV
jgi:hemolysin III